MKTQYLTTDTIESLSKQMLRDIEKSRRPVVQPFSPNESALLILDMQQYFIEPQSHAYIPSARAIVPGINALREAYLQCGYPVILTRHLNTPQNAGMMSQWWNDLILEKDPLSEIIPDFTQAQIPIIIKSQYDAFFETDLHAMLKKGNVKQLVITGVMTHLCVETTVRSAFMRGYAVWLPVDGTATYNAAFHRSTLLNLSHGFANPVLTRELLEIMETDRHETC